MNETIANHQQMNGPAEQPLTGRQKLRLVGLVILKRLRFLVILLAVGVFIGYWDTIKNYWDKWTRPSHAAARELASGQEFYCPMHPNVVRSTYEPNGDVPSCPICGMPLSVREKGEAPPLPAGVTARVQFSPERIQLAGIKTVPVDYRPMLNQVRTVGTVSFDESRLSRVVSRVAGYVEKLYVDKTFTMVNKGDRLAEIYSPELYSAAQELILAQRSTAIADLAASARKKLLLLGVDQKEIDAIGASSQAAPRLVIRSPQTGYVVSKNVVEGSSVDAQMTLLEVADLSTVWVEADVYEKDLGRIEPGQSVEATVEAVPGKIFTGQIALVYPQLDSATRTNRVRFELDNPGHELRPGMFATVRLISKSSPQEVLAIPERAVVDSGLKQVVYVEREPGLFEGVEVELGPRMGEYYPVLKGLDPGDKIAAAGGFLIDAETRLNPGAASTYFGASGGPQSGAGSAAPSGHADQRSGAAAKSEKQDSDEPIAKPTADDLKNIDKLPKEDRKVAVAQRACPITDEALGSMGIPYKLMLRGQPVFLCCKGCVAAAKRDPEGTLKKVARLKATK